MYKRQLQSHTQLKHRVMGMTPKLVTLRKMYVSMLSRLRLNMMNSADASPKTRIAAKFLR